MKLSQPFIINNWPVNVDWNLYFKWYFNLYFFLNLYLSVNVDGLVNINWLIDNDWILIDWFINKHLSFNYLWYFYLLYDDFRYFLFDFDVLGHFYNFLYHPLRPRNILRHFYPHFKWLLNHNLFYYFFWRHPSSVFCWFLQYFNLHLQFVFITFQFIYDLLMLFTWKVLTSKMVKLKLKSHSLLLTLSQLLSEIVYFFEQFF